MRTRFLLGSSLKLAETGEPATPVVETDEPSTELPLTAEPPTDDARPNTAARGTATFLCRVRIWEPVPKDTPQPEKTVRERGTFANHGDDPTLKSYLSSLFFVLSVPGFILLSIAGHWSGLYPYSYVVPVFAGLFVASLVVVFTLMHYAT